MALCELRVLLTREPSPPPCPPLLSHCLPRHPRPPLPTNGVVGAICSKKRGFIMAMLVENDVGVAVVWLSLWW